MSGLLVVEAHNSRYARSLSHSISLACYAEMRSHIITYWDEDRRLPQCDFNLNFNSMRIRVRTTHEIEACTDTRTHTLGTGVPEQRSRQARLRMPAILLRFRA